MTLLDSNVWIALFHASDTLHAKATSVVENIREPILLPEYVLVEVATVLSQKAGKDIADTFLLEATANQDIEILPSSASFLHAVVEFYRAQRNQKLSFIDYAIVYLSSQVNVVTFDNELQKELRKK